MSVKYSGGYKKSRLNIQVGKKCRLNIQVGKKCRLNIQVGIKNVG